MRHRLSLPNLSIAFLSCGLLLTSGCAIFEDYEPVRAELDAQQVQINDLTNRFVFTRTTFCEARCDHMYGLCWANVSITEGLPGTEPPRGPGPELPGCWPYDCESEEDRVRAEEDPLTSCQDLKNECVADCLAR